MDPQQMVLFGFDAMAAAAVAVNTLLLVRNRRLRKTLMVELARVDALLVELEALGQVIKIDGGAGITPDEIAAALCHGMTAAQDYLDAAQPDRLLLLHWARLKDLVEAFGAASAEPAAPLFKRPLAHPIGFDLTRVRRR